jgi:hypothetical protein
VQKFTTRKNKTDIWQFFQKFLLIYGDFLKKYLTELLFKIKNCQTAKVYHKRKHWWMLVPPSDFFCEHFDVKKRAASNVIMGTFGKFFKKTATFQGRKL